MLPYLEKLSLQLGLPGWLSSKESACNAGDSGDVGLMGLEDSLEEEMATHPRILVQVFLHKKSHGQRNLVCYGP